MGGGAVITRSTQAHINLLEIHMYIRTPLVAAVAAIALLTASGCAVTRNQETVGAYVDDAAITTSVKARFVSNKEVDATSIKVETLNGTVMLSGFAKNATEKSTAESIAMKVDGVKSVKNEIAIRP
jgi:hyperosmotically inducible periplasmic protein